MKQVIVWFFLACKRYLKKGIFPMLLLLLPLAALGIGKMESQGENRIRIAVCTAQGTEQEASWLSRQLARNLAERAKGMFDFYLCASEQEVKDEVASRRAECGYAIDPNLEEKLNQKQWKKVIRLYTAPSTVAGPLSAETVFHELAALYNRELLQMYVTEGEAFSQIGSPESEERKAAAGQAKELYDQWYDGGGLFHFAYIYDGESTGRPLAEETGAKLFPVRGLAAVFVFTMSLYGAVLLGEDEISGLFIPLSWKLRLPCRLAVLSAPTALSCVSAFFALWAGKSLKSGVAGAAEEAAALLIYGLACVAVVFLLKNVFCSPRALCCTIPFFIIGSLIFCPVFVDAGTWMPGIEQVGRLFLPYYYLGFF